jgi:hypothetical protein
MILNKKPPFLQAILVYSTILSNAVSKVSGSEFTLRARMAEQSGWVVAFDKKN